MIELNFTGHCLPKIFKAPFNAMNFPSDILRGALHIGAANISQPAISAMARQLIGSKSSQNYPFYGQF